MTATISDMSKPKKSERNSQDRHKEERTSIQISVRWLEVARELAATKKQPTLWYLLEMIAKDADAVGKERPPLPWEKKPDK